MLTVMYFTATWCGPCKTFGPTFSQVQTEFAGRKVDMNKIDVDASPALVQNFGISSVPTLVFQKDGQEVYRKSGVLSRSEFSQLINNYI